MQTLKTPNPTKSLYHDNELVKTGLVVKGVPFTVEFATFGGEVGFLAFNNDAGVGVFSPLSTLLKSSDILAKAKSELLDDPNIWACLHEAKAEKNTNKQVWEKAVKSMEQAQPKPKKSYRPRWTKEEAKIVESLLKLGFSFEEISGKTNRSVEALRFAIIRGVVRNMSPNRQAHSKPLRQLLVTKPNPIKHAKV